MGTAFRKETMENDSMPLALQGSCRCGAIRFRCESNTPVPYQRCYCSICRKTDGGGGYAINLGALANTLTINLDGDAMGVFQAEIQQDDGHCERSTGQRHFCTRCGTALWLFSPEWPDSIHPFASAIDSDLAVAPSNVHLMLRYKPGWVVVEKGAADLCFDLYPEESLEQWHKRNGMWVD